MKPISYLKTVAITLSLTLLALPVQAAEVEGVEFSETYVVDGKILQLAGAGLLRYWGFKATQEPFTWRRGSRSMTDYTIKPNESSLNTSVPSKAKISVPRRINTLLKTWALQHMSGCALKLSFTIRSTKMFNRGIDIH